MVEASFEKARFNMVEQQIRPWEVLDQRVLDLIGKLPREAFVPAEYRQLAYADTEIPYGNGQSMMAPKIEARMLQALNIQPDDKVMEVGTGTGYVTACLANLGKSVVSLEIDATLLEQAQANLEAQGIKNVDLYGDDVFEGAIAQTPFDAIAVTGSLPVMAEELKQLLRVGGRMFVVTGESPVMEASLITRVSQDAWRTEELFETELGALTNAPQADKFSF
jgi:protein-L-isoaspartate(D-aspartate) O-methyltransferase